MTKSKADVIREYVEFLEQTTEPTAADYAAAMSGSVEARCAQDGDVVFGWYPDTLGAGFGMAIGRFLVDLDDEQRDEFWAALSGGVIPGMMAAQDLNDIEQKKFH